MVVIVMIMVMVSRLVVLRVIVVAVELHMEITWVMAVATVLAMFMDRVMNMAITGLRVVVSTQRNYYETL
jgi:hypothetical protein